MGLAFVWSSDPTFTILISSYINDTDGVEVCNRVGTVGCDVIVLFVPVVLSRMKLKYLPRQMCK